MQVPYAKKWKKEMDKLRNIALDCFLTEEIKWSKPCFTFQKRNIAVIIPLRDVVALSFFKGALLRDPRGILERVGLGPGDQSARADAARVPLRGD